MSNVLAVAAGIDLYLTLLFLGASPTMGLWENPLLRLTAFTALAGFVSFLLFMRRPLRHLDPSAVIPGRVNRIASM